MAEEKSSGRIEQPGPSKREASDVVKDIMNREADPFLVEGGDPGMEYYWGSAHQQRQEAEKYARGFETVTGVTDPKLRTTGRRVDGTHQIGDAVLLRRPKEVAEWERKRNEELSRAHRKMPRKEFEEMARQQGVKITKD